MKFELPESARNIVYFRNATVETGAKFQFSATPEEILQWLVHTNLCFESLNEEYIDIEGWIYFRDWQYNDTITSVATGNCTSDWDVMGHRGQSIFIDQTQSDYWTVYFAVWFM